jgi:hypothetical protein
MTEIARQGPVKRKKVFFGRGPISKSGFTKVQDKM